MIKENIILNGQSQTKIRVTVDKNVTYRDYDVEKSMGNYGSELVGYGKVTMEIPLVPNLNGLELF